MVNVSEVKVSEWSKRPHWTEEDFHMSEEPGIYVRPETWTALEWLDYQSSHDGTKVPVETTPSSLPPYWRLARRWEKKFGVPSREALEVAQSVVEIFEGVPAPEQVGELENDYREWSDLKAGIFSLKEALQEQEETEDFMDLGQWVFAHGNLDSLLSLRKQLEKQLEDEENEVEETEENTVAGTCWRALPIFPSSVEDALDKEREKKIRERSLKALTPEQFENLSIIGRGKNWQEIKKVWQKFYSSKEEYPAYWRDRAIYKFKAQSARFDRIKREVCIPHFIKKIDEGISGPDFYKLLQRNTVFNSKNRAELWELWRAKRKKK